VPARRMVCLPEFISEAGIPQIRGSNKKQWKRIG
jgi:hypothetical protein